MNNLANNIKKLRKEKGITQKELADILNISFQAISKWENAKAQPEISYLIKLCDVLYSDLNSLLGYKPTSEARDIHSVHYKTNDSHLKLNPSKLAVEVLNLKSGADISICDIACGNGHNSIFFARNGYKVTSVDLLKDLVEKVTTIANTANISLNAYTCNILEYRSFSKFDILFCENFINYIPKPKRKEVFSYWKSILNEDGIIILNAKIKKPFLNFTYNEYTLPFYSGELMSYFDDLFFIKSEEIYKDGECYNILIAQKKKKV